MHTNDKHHHLSHFNMQEEESLYSSIRDFGKSQIKCNGLISSSISYCDDTICAKLVSATHANHFIKAH